MAFANNEYLLEDLEKASEYADKAISLNPHLSVAYAFSGKIAFEKFEFHQAFRLFSRAIFLEEDVRLYNPYKN